MPYIQIFLPMFPQFLSVAAELEASKIHRRVLHTTGILMH